MNNNLHSNSAADILIVDDNPQNLKLLRDLLTREGYKVRPATSGEIALDAIQLRKPDLILLDIRMPGMDGFEVCRRLKASTETSEIPIIFVTASTDPKGIEKGLKLGAVDYVNKPVQEGEMLARVSTHVELYKMRRHLEQMVETRTQALQESEEKFRRLVESIQNSYFFYTHDTEGVFTYLSPSIEIVLGYKPEEFFVHYLEYLTNNPVNKKVEHYSELSMRGEEQPPYEIEIYHKDGSVRWLEVKEVPVLDQQGNVDHIEGIAHDITDRKQVDKALLRAQKMDAVGQLTGGIAHDFNNILAIILGNLDLLKLQITDEDKVLKRVGEIKKAGQRAADLTKQLLSFSRSQASELAITDINQVIREMTNLITRSVTPEVEVVTQLADDLWLTEINAGNLEDALLNLILNARDAMAGHGHLTIETRNTILDAAYCDQNPGTSPGEYVELVVSDSGEGIPPEHQERVFEPFYTTKEQGKGTGLGLSMVFGFVKRSGGHIKFNSEVGVGTAFHLYLPRGKDVELTVVQHDEEIEAQLHGQETILVVDDEVGLLELTRELLEAQGYRVLTAGDGRQALDQLAKEPAIDLLFSDVVMPGGINGYELAEQATNSRPDLKVLLTSGYTEKAMFHNGQARFSANLLSKPYTQPEMSKRIRLVLDGGDSQ